MLNTISMLYELRAVHLERRSRLSQAVLGLLNLKTFPRNYSPDFQANHEKWDEEILEILELLREIGFLFNEITEIYDEKIKEQKEFNRKMEGKWEKI